MSEVWFITGSSRGLGRQICEAVLQAGHRLVATARRPQQLDDLVKKYGDQICATALDVTDPDAARAAIETAVSTFGRLDVLVNNAGQADFGSVEDTPRESFDRQINTVFGGVVSLTRATLPIMREQGNGHIIQISSFGARIGTPGLAAYQAAKAAVTVFSLSLAREVAPLGVKVTVVEPGNLRTNMTNPSSMNTLPISEPYRTTVGVVAERLRTSDGKQSGDPAKAAAVIVGLRNMVDPPTRLLLGGDTLSQAHSIAKALADSDATWSQLSSSIDFADTL
jgi:NAD(P)-dependent dehydrogenase (short-subunit alcohol dehydrogenase family)